MPLPLQLFQTPLRPKFCRVRGFYAGIPTSGPPVEEKTNKKRNKQQHTNDHIIQVPCTVQWTTPSRQRAAHGDFEGFRFDGFLRAPAHVVGGEAYGVSLGGPAEGHLGRGDGRLGGVLVVAVDKVRGQEDGDDEGEEQSRGDDGLAHVVAHGLWRRGCRT